MKIKFKIFILLLTLTIGYLLCLVVLNFTLLENYYTINKSKKLENTAKIIKNINFENDDAILHYAVKERKTGIKSIIANYNSDGNYIIYYNSFLPSYTQKNNGSNIFISPEDFMSKNGNNFSDEIIVKKDNIHGDDNKTLRILSKMQLEDKEYRFCLVYPFSAIKDNIKLFNEFALISGVIVLALFTLLTFLLSKNISKPVVEMDKVTLKLSNLNFSQRIEIYNRDEIGELAENINSMADKLEDTFKEILVLNEKLSEDNEIKDKLFEGRKYITTSISHELKTPLSIIIGYAEAIKSSTDDKKIIEYCDIITDEGEKLTRLIKNTLKVAQFSSDIIPLDKVVFDIDELIDNTIKNFDILLKEKNITLKKHSNCTFKVFADKDMILQVLSNYLSNAINHIDGEKNIDIYVFERDNAVRVTVFNTGEHIKSENLSKLWDSFFKEDKARTRAYGGHGLGLSIVKSIMVNHNNDYGVSNVEGGVSFYFEVDKA